jgi:branched-chain amino acid aminotransferase
MWLDAVEHKYVQEAGTMNLMFVIDGTLITPPTDGTILRGITRDTILKLMRSKGFPVEERNISVNELMEYYKAGKLEEAFGCGTAAVVSHVSEITYRDFKMVLPPVENRKVGAMIKTTIDKLRSGNEVDTFSWVQPVKSTILV